MRAAFAAEKRWRENFLANIRKQEEDLLQQRKSAVSAMLGGKRSSSSTDKESPPKKKTRDVGPLRPLDLSIAAARPSPKNTDGTFVCIPSRPLLKESPPPRNGRKGKASPPLRKEQVPHPPPIMALTASAPPTISSTTGRPAVQVTSYYKVGDPYNFDLSLPIWPRPGRTAEGAAKPVGWVPTGYRPPPPLPPLTLSDRLPRPPTTSPPRVVQVSTNEGKKRKSENESPDFSVFDPDFIDDDFAFIHPPPRNNKTKRGGQSKSKRSID